MRSIYLAAAGRRLLGVVAAAAVALEPAAAHADTLTDLRIKISQAQGAVQQIAAKRDGQQSIVERLRGVTGSRVSSLQSVDAELIATVNRLRQAETELERVESDIARLEGQIAAKEEAVRQRADVYGTRLRALYKYTRTSPLEQLLAARSFGDALHRITMMQAIARVDNRLLGQLRAEQDELVAARGELAVKHEQAAQLRSELDAQRGTLEAHRLDQARLVAQARAEQSAAEATLSEMDRDSQALASRITLLQAEHQRALEELERQRQEEIRRQEALRQAQATATAQARANATATAQAARGGTGPRPPATATPRAGTASSSPTSIRTADLAPSAYNMIWPVINPSVTTEYGERNFAMSFHSGIDLVQLNRAPVLAAADGIVLESGFAVPANPSASYGMMVVVAHGTSLSTLYAHLDVGGYGPAVKAGDRVKRGQVIGYIGMTGITSGPHLHFEVREGGQHRDPRKYLPK